MATKKIRSLSYPVFLVIGVCQCCCCCLFSDFLNTFCKVYICFVWPPKFLFSWFNEKLIWDKDYLKCLAKLSFIGFAEGSVLLCVSMTLIFLHLYLYFSLYFLIAQSYTVSQRCNLRIFSCLSWACTQSYTCMWPSRCSVLCWNFSKHLIPHVFLMSF